MNTVGNVTDCIRTRGNWAANWFRIRGTKVGYPLHFVLIEHTPGVPDCTLAPVYPVARKIASNQAGVVTAVPGHSGRSQ